MPDDDVQGCQVLVHKVMDLMDHFASEGIESWEGCRIALQFVQFVAELRTEKTNADCDVARSAMLRVLPDDFDVAAAMSASVLVGISFMDASDKLNQFKGIVKDVPIED